MIDREQYYLDKLKSEYNNLKIAKSSLDLNLNLKLLKFFKKYN